MVTCSPAALATCALRIEEDQISRYFIPFKSKVSSYTAMFYNKRENDALYVCHDQILHKCRTPNQKPQLYTA